MMRIVLCLLLLPLLSNAQNKALERANLYFAKAQYALALEEFDNMPTIKVSDEVRFKRAVCLYHTKQYSDAYRIFHGHHAAVPDSLLLIYLDLSKKSQKKESVFSIYKRLYSDTAEYNRLVRHYSLIPSGIEEIENLEPLNTEYSEISPAWFKDGLVFSSNREETIIERKSGALFMPTFDLYFANGDSLYPRKVSKFASKINSSHHECCATFTADFTTVYYTRTYDYAGIGGKNTIKLFSARHDGENWNENLVFRFNDTLHSYAHPALEANGEIFFFASDRLGGYGGSDIYVCFKEGEVWSEPVNLGPGVNSQYNELYPYFHADSSLYFSSNRPEGLGGYDVFKAIENEEGDYVVNANLGTAINSPFDEYSFFISRYGYGYFSSNRPGGKGAEDLYAFKLRGINGNPEK